MFAVESWDLTHFQSKAGGMIKRRPTLRLKSHTAARFNEKQLKEFKLVFATIDKDRTGKIGLPELMAIFRALGQNNITEEYIVDEMLEKSRDLQITQTSLATKLSRITSCITEEDFLLNLFSNLDKDGLGYITLDYFVEILTKHGTNRLSGEEVGSVRPVALFSSLAATPC